MAMSLFSSWTYGFFGLCPVQTSYGLLLMTQFINLNTNELEIIMEKNQNICTFSPFGPYVFVSSADAGKDNDLKAVSDLVISGMA